MAPTVPSNATGVTPVANPLPIEADLLDALLDQDVSIKMPNPSRDNSENFVVSSDFPMVTPIDSTIQPENYINPSPIASRSSNSSSAANDNSFNLSFAKENTSVVSATNNSRYTAFGDYANSLFAKTGFLGQLVKNVAPIATIISAATLIIATPVAAFALASAGSVAFAASSCLLLKDPTPDEEKHFFSPLTGPLAAASKDVMGSFKSMWSDTRNYWGSFFSSAKTAA